MTSYVETPLRSVYQTLTSSSSTTQKGLSDGMDNITRNTIDAAIPIWIGTKPYIRNASFGIAGTFFPWTTIVGVSGENNISSSTFYHEAILRILHAKIFHLSLQMIWIRNTCSVNTIAVLYYLTNQAMQDYSHPTISYLIIISRVLVDGPIACRGKPVTNCLVR